VSLADRVRAALQANRHVVPPFDEWQGAPAGERPQLTPAAVLIALVDRPEPTVILTERTTTLRRHAGQVAFPGGRIDPEDAGPVEAALREAQEEIALDPRLVDVIAALPAYPMRNGFVVHPVLAVVAPPLLLQPAEHEVAAVFEVPLGRLTGPAHRFQRSASLDGVERRYWELDWPERRIWGATAGMIVNLAARLEGLA
jgi:8-oxo-dGTP pyrophosphatase MutT (NUDIX family)